MKTREQIEERIKRLYKRYNRYSIKQDKLKERTLEQIFALEWVLKDEHEEQVIDWVKDE